jgi:hypothetical protein
MKREWKKSKVDSFLREILEFGGGTNIFEFLDMGIRVFMI